MICTELDGPITCIKDFCPKAPSCQRYASLHKDKKPKRIVRRTFEEDKKLIKSKPFYRERLESLSIAYDLCYDIKCKNDIIYAESQADIQRALINGRVRSEKPKVKPKSNFRTRFIT